AAKYGSISIPRSMTAKATAGTARPSTASTWTRPKRKRPAIAPPNPAARRSRAMSILDAVMGAAEKHPELSQEQHANLMQTAMQMFGNHSNLSGLANSAEAHGLGGMVQSWISSGANQSIAPQQLESLVGQERINQLATRTGIPPAIASAALARVLPVIVDK